MKTPSCFLRRAASVMSVGLATLATQTAHAVPSPEQDALQTSRSLQPIPDERWKEIAGERISAEYRIEENDTLYDISSRLFGDPKYWPKIWALNNAKITNPHFIQPGKAITFLPGTGSSLPGVEIADASAAARSAQTNSSGGSESEEIVSDAPLPPQSPKWKGAEWKKIPPGQAWETITVQLPPEVDPDGFDRRSKIFKKFPSGFELSEIPATQPIQPLGTIVGSRSESIGIGLNETLFIDVPAGGPTKGSELQVDQEFTVVGQPYLFKDEERDDLTLGYSYPILGKVRIVGKSGPYTMGKVINLQGAITRDTMLIQTPGRVDPTEPIPGSGAVEATVRLSRHYAAYAAAQGKIVYLTRGTEDGVRNGMVFRVFQTEDPYTQKTIAKDGVVREADLQVILASDRLSLALVRMSSSTVIEGARAVLLTDISDVTQKVEFRQGAIVDDAGKSVVEPASANGSTESSSPQESSAPTSGPTEDLPSLDEFAAPPETPVAPEGGETPSEATDLPPPKDLPPPAEATDLPPPDNLPPPDDLPPPAEAPAPTAPIDGSDELE
jgi:hypothetical protein